jgi:hypothetical protein
VDILGNLKVDPVAMQQQEEGAEEMSSYLGGEQSIGIDYPSKKVHGIAQAHYDAEQWSPTVGVRAWRFILTSRFGLKTRARGSLEARYTLPFFIDPETFDISLDFTDMSTLLDPELQSQLSSNAADSLSFYSDDEMEWRMPQGHTISFDIIPKKFRFSYTKFFGDIEMHIDNIRKIERELEGERVVEEEEVSADSVVSFDLGFSVDHIMLLTLKLDHFFCNAGIFTFDIHVGDTRNILSKNYPAVLDNKAILPVFNFGSSIGTKLQLLLELDILPLPAVKSGVFYYF